MGNIPGKEEARQRRVERLGKKMGSMPIPEDQPQRTADLDQGKTVGLNIQKDLHLLKYALAKGLYVRCDGVSEWANPFVANVEGTYEEGYDLPFKKERLSCVHMFKGKALGAHGYPEKCPEVEGVWVVTKRYKGYRRTNEQQSKEGEIFRVFTLLGFANIVVQRNNNQKK